MKNLMAIIFLLVSFQALGAEKFETKCKKNNCFQNGWITTGKNYVLDTVCKNNNCPVYGWSSIAKDKSTYDVTCKKGGCFVKGWKSEQKISFLKLRDEVTCKLDSCLTDGWTVLTGYDLMGGDVTCHQYDCSRFGGYSVWRGRSSHTSCYEGGCYTRGWTLYID